MRIIEVDDIVRIVSTEEFKRKGNQYSKYCAFECYAGSICKVTHVYRDGVQLKAIEPQYNFDPGLHNIHDIEYYILWPYDMIELYTPDEMPEISDDEFNLLMEN